MPESFAPPSWILVAGFLLVAGCARDPLEQTAWQASRVGTAVGEGRGGRDTAGLDAGGRVVERFYYVAKYEASLQQRHAAEATARAVTRRRAGGHAMSPRKTARYLAIRTRSDSRAKTSTSVMLWDTQSQEIVGGNVYDLNDTPPSGTILNFETYAAEYVGAGG